MQQVIVSEREEDGYTVGVPALPNFKREASTYREAVKKLIETFSALPESEEQPATTFTNKSNQARSLESRGRVS
jgi:hypothetical protein